MQINGLKVVDAKKKITLKISQQDVKKGKSKSPASCAAARACLRQVPNCTAARVHMARTYVKIKNKWVRFYTPHSLRGEIIAYDRGASFQPGEYVLKPLASYHRAGSSQGASTPRNGGKKRRHYHMVENVRHYDGSRL